MPDNDDPFKPADGGTVLRPRPGAGKRGADERGSVPARAPVPGVYAEPAALRQAMLGAGLNPLVRAATPLLILLGQVRATVTMSDVPGLRRHVLEEIRRFEESARTAGTARQPRQFPNAQMTIADGEKTKQVDVTVSYTADTFQLLDKDTRKALKEFAYKSFVGGEYSYSKAPRWKSGVFISPFLFLSSGKKHWLLVKATDDYVMLRLDKVNYKLIIAEWETRTGLKVEAQGENK